MLPNPDRHITGNYGEDMYLGRGQLAEDLEEWLDSFPPYCENMTCNECYLCCEKAAKMLGELC